MKLSEIADVLQKNVVRFTDAFHEVIAIQSITADSNVATFLTDNPHGLSEGDTVNIIGVETKTPIDSITVNGFTATIVTTVPHDLTENNPDTKFIRFDGFSDQAFNSTGFELKSVPNRRTFSVATASPFPTLTGNEVLLEPNRIDGVNGRFQVSGKPTLRGFAVEGSFIPGTYTPVNGKVAAPPNIAVCVSMERAEEIYSENEKAWLFVMPDGATVSKDRASISDATATFQSGATMRLKVIEEFVVVAFIPVNSQLAAEEALDLCMNEIWLSLISSLFGFKPTSGFFCPTSDYKIIPIAHEVIGYNNSVLSYGYTFQAPMDLTTEDAALLSGDRAFRNIDYSHDGLPSPATAEIDLDDEPL